MDCYKTQNSWGYLQLAGFAQRMTFSECSRFTFATFLQPVTLILTKLRWHNQSGTVAWHGLWQVNEAALKKHKSVARNSEMPSGVAADTRMETMCAWNLSLISCMCVFCICVSLYFVFVWHKNEDNVCSWPEVYYTRTTGVDCPTRSFITFPQAKTPILHMTNTNTNTIVIQILQRVDYTTTTVCGRSHLGESLC